jgi:hypothetical protein
MISHSFAVTGCTLSRLALLQQHHLLESLHAAQLRQGERPGKRLACAQVDHHPVGASGLLFGS